MQGTNQIVGIGDTGLDLQSCFFADSSQPDMPSGSGAGWGTDGNGAACTLRPHTFGVLPASCGTTEAFMLHVFREGAA